MENKHPLLSRTVWSGILTIVAGLAGIENVADFAANADTVVAILGGLGAIYFRLRARKALRP